MSPTFVCDCVYEGCFYAYSAECCYSIPGYSWSRLGCLVVTERSQPLCGEYVRVTIVQELTDILVEVLL